MSSDNPYAAPGSDVEVIEPAQSELASRWRRLGGSLIDGLLMMIIIFPLMMMIGFWDLNMVPTGTSTQEMIVSAVLGIGSFLFINGYLLMTSGQTVGKRLLNMRIVSVKDDKILPFGKLIGLRYLPIWVVSQVPVLGPILNLLNAAIIFGNDCRCGHDYIAGTKVVMAGP